MGIIKDLFGVSSKENSDNQETENKETTNIINYEIKGDMIYGYLNQEALDTYIYNRAKERTNDFADKDKWREEEGKRPVSLEDIRNIEHNVLNFPISDGEYVSTDNLILVVGLNGIKSDNYCDDNHIAQWDTWIYIGVMVYSEYEGYFTNCIEDTHNHFFGKPIKQGDLLFTIQKGNKPEKVEGATHDVVFDYTMLSKSFLNSIPYLSDITTGNWFVDNYSHVNKGDAVLEITDYSTTSKPKYKTIITSPYSGLITKGKNYGGKLSKNTLLFSVYEDESKLYDKYPNEIVVEKDDFTNATTIKGKRYGGEYSGFKLGNLLHIQFEHSSNKSFLVLKYDKLRLNNRSSFHLLLEDGSILILNAVSKPIKKPESFTILKFSLTPHDIETLSQTKFLKWQITNEEGTVLQTGNNEFFVVYGDKSGITQNISYEVFKNFMKEFYTKILEHNPESFDQPKSESKELTFASPRSQESRCSVYLMIDTTNNFHKIGISNKPKYREHTLQSDKPTIELICSHEYPTRTIAEAIEAALHKAFAQKRIRGEWFNLDPQDVQDIKETLGY